MDLTPDPVDPIPHPGNVVFISPAAEAENLEIRRAEKAKAYPCCGMHKKIIVDEVSRTITCQACGFVIDPFSYILQWANEGDRRMNAMRSMEAKAASFSRECEDLKRKCDNLRARLKRAGFPQPEVERSAYRHERDNTGFY